MTERTYRVLACSLVAMEQRLAEYAKEGFKPILLTGDPNGYTIIFEREQLTIERGGVGGYQ